MFAVGIDAEVAASAALVNARSSVRPNHSDSDSSECELMLSKSGGVGM